MTAPRTLLWIALIAVLAGPAWAVQFSLASVNGNTWTYTLTFDPEDNYCRVTGSCTATITLRGLYGVVSATPPASTDFPPGSEADSVNRNWTPAVQGNGTMVVWSNVNGGTGNYNSTRHAFGFSVTAIGAANGIAPVVTSQFCLDDGPPCTSLDIDTTAGGPVNPAAGSNVGSMAQTVSAAGWGTLFTLVNKGGLSANAMMNFNSNLGNPLSIPISGLLAPVTSLVTTLDPNATVMLDSPVNDGTPQAEGWTNLFAAGPVDGFAIFEYPTNHWEAVVPLESRNARSYILAFDNTAPIGTGVAIANLSGSAANIPVFINDDQGNRIGLDTLMVPPLGHTSITLTDKYAMTVGIRGTIEFDTPNYGTPLSQQISVLGLRANGPALTTLPVLADVNVFGGNLTHILFNGGFTNSFTLVNTGPTTAFTMLSFFAGDGTPLNLPMFLPQTGENLSGTTLARNLAPGATLLVETVGQDGVSSVEGSAQLTTDGNVGGFGIFRWTQFQQEASVPIETRNPNSYLLAFDDTGVLNTGVAVANASNQMANITVILRDDTGAILLNTVIPLNPNGHISFMLPDRYAMAAGRRGTVEFVTPQNGRISVIGLRATNAGTLTTIPILAKN